MYPETRADAALVEAKGQWAEAQAVVWLVGVAVRARAVMVTEVRARAEAVMAKAEGSRCSRRPAARRLVERGQETEVREVA